jgi:hypothetical protein
MGGLRTEKRGPDQPDSLTAVFSYNARRIEAGNALPNHIGMNLLSISLRDLLYPRAVSPTLAIDQVIVSGSV